MLQVRWLLVEIIAVEPMTFPAIKGRQGDRTMYLLMPSAQSLVAAFGHEVEPHDERSQRPLIPRHARGIAHYVVENRADYVLGALTYALDVPVEFRPVTPGAELGVLCLSPEILLRSIDGQHRRVGIEEALGVVNDLGDDSVAVVVYVEVDVAKRRQMFSDMNWTARKVSASQNIAFDNRDPFSRAVRRLVHQHRFLANRVETEGAQVKRDSAKLYTLAAVYDAARRLQLGPDGKITRALRVEEADIVDRCRRFFDLLALARPELAEATDAGTLRALRQENLLVSSTALRVVAGAVWVCIQRWRDEVHEGRIEDLQEPLAHVDFHPAAEFWQQAGFVSPGKTTPNARAQEVRYATNLLAAKLLRIG